MKLIRTVFVLHVILAVLCVAPLRAQAPVSRARVSTETETPPPFLPLQQWKAAVIAGDKSALAAFYIIPPPGTKVAPQDTARDPNGEPGFWSSLRGAGLSQFDVKILEIKNLQSGAMSFVLRYELKLGSSPTQKSQVISGAQVWVEQGGKWRILSTQRGDLAISVARRLPEPAVPNTHLYPPPEQARIELGEALAAATKNHKRIILVFGGNWCYDCHVLDAAFHSKETAAAIAQNYHVVHINVGEFNKNTEIAERYEIPLEKGVPSLAVLDQDGRLLFSQKQGEFESTTRIGPEDVSQFLQRWKPQLQR